MKKPRYITTWQELLKGRLRDRQERARLATVLRIHPVTLARWALGTTRPREHQMLELLDALPTTLSQEFLQLALIDFPNLAVRKSSRQLPTEQVPSAFYAQMIRAYATLTFPLNQQTLQDLLFQQTIEQLDPERSGMSISLATCVRPLEGNAVRSLRQVAGIGTRPWKRDLEQQTILFGAESLAGYALTHSRSVVVPNRQDLTLFPVRWMEHEQSIVAIPIARHTRLCGCLLAASALADAFQEGGAKVRLLEHYAHLAALLFEERDFYAPETIQLRIMPPDEVQHPLFKHLNLRIVQQFRLAQVRTECATLEQVRHQVWREIEEELIQTVLPPEHPLSIVWRKDI